MEKRDLSTKFIDVITNIFKSLSFTERIELLQNLIIDYKEEPTEEKEKGIISMCTILISCETNFTLFDTMEQREKDILQKS